MTRLLRLWCRIRGHLDDSALIYTERTCGHLTACLRCGTVLETKVYTGRFPVPRGDA